MAVDGNLVFDTKIDNGGFDKGAESLRSKAAKLAGEYRKQGMNSSDAFKKAWSEIERTSKTSAANTRKHWEQSSQGIRSSISGVSDVFKGFALSMGAVFGAYQLLNIGRQAISTASALQEVQNVVDTAFSDMSYKMEEFAKTSIESFGISKLAAKQTGSIFMAMGAGMGIAQENASDMAIALTGLSADMSSFYNVSQELASTALKSIYTGETETLKQYGIVMTEANLQQFALSQGITKSVQAMTQAEKVQLRYNFVMAQTALAQGDFARTSNSWANQTRILSQQWREFLGILGTGLIQVLTPVVKLLNGMMASLISFANSATKVLASIFNIKTATTGAAAAVTDVSTGTESASAGLDNMGKSAEKASKKARKSTAGIDELNVLASDVADSADNAAGALGGLGGTGDYGMNITPTVEEADTSEFESSISKLANGLKNLAILAAEAYKVGFETGLGDINLDEISKHISGIKKSLEEIFTDPEVLGAATAWVISTANSLGEITGSMASIGLTTAELFFGSIDKYLSQNKKFLTDKIVSLFDLSAKRGQIYSNFSVAIADIFTVFRGDEAKQIGADLIAIFTNSLLSIIELGLKFTTDIMRAITQPIIDSKGQVKTAIENTLSPISTIVSGISGLLSSAFESINTAYDTYIAPALEKFSSGFGTVFSGLLESYNTYLAPTFDLIAEKFTVLAEDYMLPFIETTAGLAGSIISLLSEVWDFISPFVSWLIDNAFAKIAVALQLVWTAFEFVFSSIMNTLTTVRGVLQGFIDFITGVFTGDWDKALGGIQKIFESVFKFITNTVKIFTTFISSAFTAVFTLLSSTVTTGMNGITTLFSSGWTKIKTVFAPAGTFFTSVWTAIKTPFASVATWFEDTFSKAWTKVKNVFSTGGKIFDGIKDGIADTFKTVVNGLITGINKVLSIPFAKINSMLNSIKNVSVGPVKPFSGLWSNNPISTPSIPKLATGTVVPANYGEFMAILGDNKRETEVVSPLSTIEKAVENVMKRNGGGNSGGNITIQCVLDGRIVYENVITHNNRNTRITGRNAFAQ